MKIRTVKYIIKEGVLNTYKNALMSLASVGIVTASLIIFGIFLLIVVNMSHNAKVLNQQSEMEVFCEYELDDFQVGQIEQAIRENANIKECRKVTAAEAFEKFKNSLGENADVLEGFDVSLMSVSFVVKLTDPEKSSETEEQLKTISGVRKITYFQDVIDLISKLTRWVNLISVFLIIVFLVISVFIIANTIKLTVFARRKEINIMKYIGATDWFIRWPFVIEGVIIGIIGALVAFIITGYSYSAVESRFNSDLLEISRNFINFVKASEIKWRIILMYCTIGITVGAAGSFISLRKYLRV